MQIDEGRRVNSHTVWLQKVTLYKPSCDRTTYTSAWAHADGQRKLSVSNLVTYISGVNVFMALSTVNFWVSLNCSISGGVCVIFWLCGLRSPARLVPVQSRWPGGSVWPAVPQAVQLPTDLCVCWRTAGALHPHQGREQQHPGQWMRSEMCCAGLGPFILVKVFRLSGGHCVYTWPSQGGCEPHSARLLSRDECNLCLMVWRSAAMLW